MRQVRMHWSAVVFATAVILFAGLGQQAHAQAPLGQVSSGPAQNARLAQNSVSQMFSRAPAPAEMGYLGVAITEVSSQQVRQMKLPKPEGVYVVRVEPGSPAAKAGIEARDVIVGYYGRSVIGALQFRRLVEETPPGRSVAILVYRKGKERTLAAQITSPPSSLESQMPGPQSMLRNMPSMAMNQPSSHPLLGVSVMLVRGQLARYFQVPGERGVLVISVAPGSVAEKAGVKAGDVIYEVEGKAVQTTGQLEQALRSNCSANGVSLAIVRKGMTLVVNAAIKCPASTPSNSGK